MKTFQKGIFLLIVALFVGAAAFAQKKSVAQKADDLFDQKQFIAARAMYEEAYNKMKTNKAEKNRIYFQMGECHRLMYEYEKAEKIYKRLASQKYYNTEPKLYFYLAEMCRFNSKYDEADEYYEKYLEVEPNDVYARSRKSSLIYVNQLVNDRTRHVITPMESWNTPENDWAPRFVGSDTTKLVFTSSRFDGGDGRHDVWTGQALSDLYVVFQDRKGSWSSTPETFEAKGTINSNVNEGEATFTADGSMIFFTRCDESENQTRGCAIYTSTRALPQIEEGKKSKKKKKSDTEEQNTDWGTPVKLNLGDTMYNYMYPAISEDGLTLYFSSNMPGGMGGYDLWKAKRASVNDDFGKPVNMGSKINTEGLEGFPMVYGDSVLYFSSNGLPGMGGLDMFRYNLKGGKNAKAENLGVPLNSSMDEMSIVYYPQDEDNYMMERGYFSSNRLEPDPHKKNQDRQRMKGDAPNDNIYYFELPPLLYTIEGTVRDEKSMQLVEHAKVKIVGSNGTEFETYTNKKGFYRFDNSQIRRGVVYKMFFSKVDYFTLESSESTCGYTTNKDIVHDVRIEPVPKQPVVLPEIRYDLAKWELKEEFMDSLMDLYLVMINNPNVVVEIRAHTDCRPYIGLTNDTLSQRRAQSVVDYLVSRGIERERLVAKGYGERVPRVLDKDMIVRVNGKPYRFTEGTILECDYVSNISDPDHQEAAHLLNRRIEFLVLRTDYVSRKLIESVNSDTPIAQQTEDGKIIDLVNRPLEQENNAPEIIHDESILPVSMIQSTKGEITCIVNGSQMPMLIDERYSEPLAISWEEAMNLLYQRRINKEDFPDRDEAFDPEGNILDKATIIFKNVQIGQKVVHNIEMVVVKGIDYKFIINRGGLSQFGEYEFDKQRGKLYFMD